MVNYIIEFSTFIDIIEDKKSINAFTHAKTNEEGRIIKECLQNLTEKERIIVIGRYGLDNAEPRTLESIGKDLGLTRERIRQIQGIAIKKLRRIIKRFKLNA